MRRILALGTVALPFAISDVARGEEPGLLLRRPDRAYEAPRFADPAPSRNRIGTEAGTRRGVYGQDGRRIGTVESKPWGGYGFYDNRGRRR